MRANSNLRKPFNVIWIVRSPAGENISLSNRPRSVAISQPSYPTRGASQDVMANFRSSLAIIRRGSAKPETKPRLLSCPHSTPKTRFTWGSLMFKFLVIAATILLSAQTILAHAHGSESTEPPPPKQDTPAVPVRAIIIKNRPMLVDLKGMTLYYFERDDSGDKSTCDGKCSESWISGRRVRQRPGLGRFHRHHPQRWQQDVGQSVSPALQVARGQGPRTPTAPTIRPTSGTSPGRTEQADGAIGLRYFQNSSYGGLAAAHSRPAHSAVAASANAHRTYAPFMRVLDWTSCHKS